MTSWLSIYDDHLENYTTLHIPTRPTFSCPPIIVINGAAQEDKPGWPVISGPEWVLTWVGYEMRELDRKRAKVQLNLNKWEADESRSWAWRGSQADEGEGVRGGERDDERVKRGRKWIEDVRESEGSEELMKVSCNTSWMLFLLWESLQIKASAERLDVM